MKNPCTYLDKERTNSRYYFISYSHRDADAVYSILENLFKNGVNYWYDVELDPGDKWNARVQRIIDDEHCIGAICFLSANSLVSDAVNKEVEYMLNKPENSFRITSIVLGYDNAKSLLFDVAQNDDNFYNSGFAKFNELTQKRLWILEEEAVDKISALALKHNVTDKYTFNIRDSYLSDLPSKTYNGKRSFICGKYPFDIDEHEEDVLWSILERTEDEITLVSNYCLDFISESEISSWIKNFKMSLSDVEYVSNIRLINESIIGRHSDLTDSLPTNYADKHRNQVLRAFWVLKGDGKKEEYCLYNSLNAKIKEQIDYRRINAGVRLLLVIKNDKIRSV